MRLLLKNENGCTVCVPIQQSDSFLDIRKRLFKELGLEFDIENFKIKGNPVENNLNVLNYLQLHSDENENTNLKSQICRLCGETFAVSAMLDVSKVKDKIIDCLHLKVDSNNLLSNLVCQDCVEKLNSFQKFLDDCLSAEKKQLEILESHKNVCPFCHDSSGQITFINHLDFLMSKERHENICSKAEKVKREDKTSQRKACDIEACHDSKVMSCCVCKLTFKQNSQFRDHVKKHLNEEKSFEIVKSLSYSDSDSSKKLFETQDEKEKSGTKSMYCDMCPKSFRSKKRLKFHIKFHLNGLNARKCTLCKKEYSSEIYLYNHIQHNHSKRKYFPCDVCRKRFRNKSSLAYHLRSHESFEAMKPFLCSICNKRFVRKSILQDHIMNRHGVGTNTRPGTCVQCQVCKEIFPDTNSGISHTEIHHVSEMNDKTGFSFNMQTVYRLFICEFCDKCYSLPEDLMEHRLRHSHPQRYQCKICNEEFRSFSEMRTHLDDHTADGIADYKAEFEVPIFYICQFCGKYFKSNHAFRTHSNTHLDDKSYQCQFCSAVFSSYSESLKHKRLHGNAKNHLHQNVLRPFECQSCQKAFTSNSSLTKHIRIHTGEKPFRCNICRKDFRQSSGLYTHLKIHSNDRPYKCDFCSKSFKLIGNYKQHLKHHTGMKSSNFESFAKLS